MLKEFEGYFCMPYLCPAGKCTIGYGTNLEAHREFIPYENIRNSKLVGRELMKELHNVGMFWGKDKAEEVMRAELVPTIRELFDKIPAFSFLITNNEQVRAECVLDMAYNMGANRLLDFNTTMKAIGSGRYNDAADAMTKSKWYKQVGRRGRTVVYAMRHNEWILQN